METTRIEEKKMIAAAKEDIKDFAPLYENYYIPVFRFVYKRMERKEDAEDIVSSVFIKAMSGIKKYESGETMFAAWLYKIAMNEVNLFYRSKKTEEKYYLETSTIQTAAEDIYQEEDVTNLLTQSLEFLPTEDYELIQLKYFDGLSFQEIALMLNKTEDNLKVKMHRLRNRLRKDILSLSTKKGIELALILSLLINILFL